MSKKKDNLYFDVTLDSFNGAEVCKFVTLFHRYS